MWEQQFYFKETSETLHSVCRLTSQDLDWYQFVKINAPIEYLFKAVICHLQETACKYLKFVRIIWKCVKFYSKVKSISDYGWWCLGTNIEDGWVISWVDKGQVRTCSQVTSLCVLFIYYNVCYVKKTQCNNKENIKVTQNIYTEKNHYVNL